MNKLQWYEIQFSGNPSLAKAKFFTEKKGDSFIAKLEHAENTLQMFTLNQTKWYSIYIYTDLPVFIALLRKKYEVRAVTFIPKHGESTRYFDWSN